MASDEPSIHIPRERILGPFWTDESAASIRQHYRVRLDVLRPLLAARGLHVVDAAEYAVVEAARESGHRIIGAPAAAVLDAIYRVSDADVLKLYRVSDADVLKLPGPWAFVANAILKLRGR